MRLVDVEVVQLAGRVTDGPFFDRAELDARVGAVRVECAAVDEERVAVGRFGEPDRASICDGTPQVGHGEELLGERDGRDRGTRDAHSRERSPCVVIALRPGVEAGGPELVGPGPGRLHQDFLSRPRREEELLLRHQASEAVAVARYFVEAVPVEPQQVVQVRSDIPDAPQLRLARAQRDRGVAQAVHRADGVVADPTMHDLPTADLRVFEQQQVLGHLAQLWKRVEQAFDDQRTGHTVSHLLIGAAVGMRMVPIQSR